MSLSSYAPIVLVENLCKTINNKPILFDINFSLNQGEILSILGPNGAGKTTLINTLLGRTSIDSGAITLLDEKPASMTIKRQTGVMLQVADLPHMSTTKEHIELFRSYYSQPMSYDDIVTLAGLSDIEHQYSKSLSGGEKQKLLFALAICGNPKILFLDEPTVGMDINARKSLWEVIKTLKSQGTSILMTTHYLEEADQLSDRIIMLKNGEIIREGSPKYIKSHVNTKKIIFSTHTKIPSLDSVQKIIKLSQDQDLLTHYELESTCAEQTIIDIINKKIEIQNLTIIAAGLEEAFELLNNNDSLNSQGEQL